MSDDDVIDLHPEGPPPLGDEAYRDVQRFKRGCDVVSFRSSEAKSAVDNVLDGGVTLEHIAREIGFRQNGCRHIKTTVIPERRRITCDDCGSDVDAFDILAGIADRERLTMRMLFSRDNLGREIKALRAQVDTLKRAAKSWQGKRDRARKATEKAQQLGLADLYELERWRDRHDAAIRRDSKEYARLDAILRGLMEARKEDGE